MESQIHKNLPSRQFAPRVYGVGAWTPHLHFAYDLVATLKPRLLVELGVDRGESYFAFCQSAAENETGTKCFGIDTWCGDQHVGGYDETTFAQVSTHNRANYEAFSTLIRASFDTAVAQFSKETIDLLHIDGLHTETAVRHDLSSWLPSVRPGGLILLHDVDVRRRDFGVWRLWEDLQQSGRSRTFHDGPGLGVWQKPPPIQLPGFLEQLLTPTNEQNSALAQYYRDRGDELQHKISEQWRDGTIRQTPFAQQTIIQVFYTSNGSHSEEDSVYARVGHEEWKDLRIELPPGAGAAPLRIDFVSAFTTIDISAIRVGKGNLTCLSIPEDTGFESIRLAGDAQRLDHPSLYRLQITGVDPQLYLPVANIPADGAPLVLQIRLQIQPSPRSGKF